MNPDLEKYTDDLLVAKQLPADLDQAVKDQMKQDLYGRVEEKLKMSLLAAMSPEWRDDFSTLLASAAPDNEVQEFVARALPNAEQIMSVALVEFQQSYLG